MTELIIHRVNTVESLNLVPQNFGVEVDIRSNGGELIVHHDPFSNGVSFDEWLNFYRHGTLILNVKEEGLEPFLIEKMREKSIRNYFFLDQSFPFLLKFSEKSGGRSAVRFSEYEHHNTALSLAKKVSWVWIDCFQEFSLDASSYKSLVNAGFRFCIVSPELQGRNPESEIPRFASEFKKLKFKPDAICTKVPLIWGAVVEIP